MTHPYKCKCFDGFPETLGDMVSDGSCVLDNIAMVSLKARPMKKGIGGKRDGGGSQKSRGTAALKSGDGVDGRSGGDEDNEVQVVREVLDKNLQMTSVAVKRYNRNVYRT